MIMKFLPISWKALDKSHYKAVRDCDCRLLYSDYKARVPSIGETTADTKFVLIGFYNLITGSVN